MTSRVNLDDLRDAILNDFIEDVADGTLEFHDRIFELYNEYDW